METAPNYTYSPWRHGGWYVDNIRYPSGAVGCVSRNYRDRKWRIVCDPRPLPRLRPIRPRNRSLGYMKWRIDPWIRSKK